MDKREIRERLNNATSGKWEYYGDWGGDAPECFVEAVEQSTAYPFAVADFDFGNSISQETPEQVDNDGEFIAHAPEDIRALLDLVDTQAKQIEELENGYEVFRVALIEMQDRDNAIIDKLQKQIAEGREIVVNWTLDFVSQEGQRFINRCKGCGSVVDEWDKGHSEGCKIGAWLKVTG